MDNRAPTTENKEFFFFQVQFITPVQIRIEELENLTDRGRKCNGLGSLCLMPRACCFGVSQCSPPGNVNAPTSTGDRLVPSLTFFFV